MQVLGGFDSRALPPHHAFRSQERLSPRKPPQARSASGESQGLCADRTQLRSQRGRRAVARERPQCLAREPPRGPSRRDATDLVPRPGCAASARDRRLVRARVLRSTSPFEVGRTGTPSVPTGVGSDGPRSCQSRAENRGGDRLGVRRLPVGDGLTRIGVEPDAWAGAHDTTDYCIRRANRDVVSGNLEELRG